MPTARPLRDLSWALLIAACAFAAALAIGSTPLSIAQVWDALLGDGPSMHAQIVRELRLPRALAAFAAGGLLAYAGCLMQVLLRNPLADPYILGIAGGAASGSLAAMLLELPQPAVVAAGWLGALASIALLLRLGAHDPRASSAEIQGHDSLRLLLVGVALATGWGALITLILIVAPDVNLRGMLFWLMGDLDNAESYWPALIALVVALGCMFALGRDLNVVMRGAPWAQTLGVSVRRVRLSALLLASAATTIAVTTAGTIGFVGLLVPNAVRILVGGDQRIAVPVSILCGGALLTVADSVARSIVAPLQLPVGAIIALAGVPAFVWIVVRHRS